MNIRIVQIKRILMVMGNMRIEEEIFGFAHFESIYPYK